jgi:hypothetical protein
MPLRKAIDDLREVTLAALPGRWRKLLYFARLRHNEPHKYSHWGFERKYGKEADTALREAHSSVFRDVLRSPLPELLDDLEENDLEASMLTSGATEGMAPIECEAQSESHFRYLLSSVKAVLQRRKAR